jgi:type II secretory pathway component PulJ
MTTPRHCPRRRAFSLLELILALGMVAMLSVTLYMSLNIAIRAKERSIANVAPIRTALLAADIVRQDFESVLPPNQQTSLTLSGPFIGLSQGGADSIDFYCIGNDAGWNTPPQQQGGLGRNAAQPQESPFTEGPRHVTISLRTDTQPPSLVRGVTRNLLAPTLEQPEEEILVRNVKSFTLRYFDGSAWQDSWDSTTLGDILPPAVEMTLEVNIDDPKPNQPPSVYRVVRVFPLANAKPADATAATGGAP